MLPFPSAILENLRLIASRSTSSCQDYTPVTRTLLSTSLAAIMPTAPSQRLPRSSESDLDDITLDVAEFMRECQDLADGKGLPGEQKVDAMLRYVRRSLQNQPGYSDAFWCHIWDQIQELYPDIAANTPGLCTRQDLIMFVERSAECLIRDECNVTRYYRNFPNIVIHLHDNEKLTGNDVNALFFEGFHPDDQDILADEVFKVKPRHPVNRPFDIRDLLSAAGWYFASDRFYQPLQLRLRNNLHSRSRTHHRDEPEKFIKRLFACYNDSSDSGLESDSSVPSSPEPSTYETQRIRSKEPSSARSSNVKDEHDAAVALITKMKDLLVSEPSYLAHYLQCQERFPYSRKTSQSQDSSPLTRVPPRRLPTGLRVLPPRSANTTYTEPISCIGCSHSMEPPISAETCFNKFH